MISVADQAIGLLQAKEHNKLSHIVTASDFDMDVYVRNLIIKMNVDYDFFKFGVCRLHKHFELQATECCATEFLPESVSYKTKVVEYGSELVPW